MPPAGFAALRPHLRAAVLCAAGGVGGGVRL